MPKYDYAKMTKAELIIQLIGRDSHIDHLKHEYEVCRKALKNCAESKRTKRTGNHREDVKALLS